MVCFPGDCSAFTTNTWPSVKHLKYFASELWSIMGSLPCFVGISDRRMGNLDQQDNFFGLWVAERQNTVGWPCTSGSHLTCHRGDPHCQRFCTPPGCLPPLISHPWGQLISILPTSVLQPRGQLISPYCCLPGHRLVPDGSLLLACPAWGAQCSEPRAV